MPPHIGIAIGKQFASGNLGQVSVQDGEGGQGGPIGAEMRVIRKDQRPRILPVPPLATIGEELALELDARQHRQNGRFQRGGRQPQGVLNAA